MKVFNYEKNINPYFFRFYGVADGGLLGLQRDLGQLESGSIRLREGEKKEERRRLSRLSR